MTVITAKVVNGQLDVPQGSLPEGATVTIVVPDGEGERFSVSVEEKATLLKSIAQADRGELIDAWEFLRSLQS